MHYDVKKVVYKSGKLNSKKGKGDRQYKRTNNQAQNKVAQIVLKCDGNVKAWNVKKIISSYINII